MFTYVCAHLFTCFCVHAQLETEKAELGERRREAELERAAARDEASRLEQELLDLCAEKRALEASQSHLQEARHSLERELSLLRREKAQALEQLAQVRPNPPPPLFLPLQPPWDSRGVRFAAVRRLMGPVVTLTAD